MSDVSQPDPRRATVITVSDRVASGEREDRSGPELANALEGVGWRVESRVVPDGVESVRAAIEAALADGSRVVMTTGGTGLSPRDLTPEATRSVVDREIPGLATLLVQQGLKSTPYAALSRGVIGIVDARADRPGAFVANLPGSTNGVREGCAVLAPMLAHIVEQIDGGDH